MEKQIDFYALERKYRDVPRLGWSEKGNRRKDNQTIEVNRKEIVDAMQRAESLHYMSNAFLHENIFYARIIGAIAEGEEDATECDRCTGIYLLGWLDGKCPYCMAEEAGENAAKNKEVPPC